MNNMNFKQKIGTFLIFGRAFPLFFRLSKFLKYLIAVIQNNTFNGNINGEFWLREQFLNEHIYLDVGFNLGEWSKYIAKKNINAKIYAFDPNPDVISAFKKEENNFTNIVLQELALSHTQGNLDFYDYGNMNGCNSLSSREVDFEKNIKPKIYPVKVTTIDQWCKEKNIQKINFLKIDAEGFDLNILEGSVNMLKEQNIEIIMFEYSTGWLCSKRLLEEAVRFFEKTNYKLFKLFNNFLLPFNYKTEYEGSFFSMFVVLSENKLKEKRIQKLIRNLNIL